MMNAASAAVASLARSLAAELRPIRVNAIAPGTVDTGVWAGLGFVTEHNTEYAAALRYASDDRKLPVLFHCTSGKDRTGFAIAVLLMAVGTPRETILADYVLTNEFRRDIGHLFGPATPAAVADLLMSAQAKYPEAAFEQIDHTYGSADAYLERGLGIDAQGRARLVENLTEPEPAHPSPA